MSCEICSMPRWIWYSPHRKHTKQKIAGENRSGKTYQPKQASEKPFSTHTHTYTLYTQILAHNGREERKWKMLELRKCTSEQFIISGEKTETRWRKVCVLVSKPQILCALCVHFCCRIRMLLLFFSFALEMKMYARSFFSCCALTSLCFLLQQVQSRQPPHIPLRSNFLSFVLLFSVVFVATKIYAFLANIFVCYYFIVYCNFIQVIFSMVRQCGNNGFFLVLWA